MNEKELYRNHGYHSVRAINRTGCDWAPLNGGWVVACIADGSEVAGTEVTAAEARELAADLIRAAEAVEALR